RPRARRRRDEDEDSDDDDRPRRRRRRDEEEDEEEGGGLIPTKNRPALIGYYLGFLGLLPVIGVFLGPVVVVLGFIGLSRARQDPHAGGGVHAAVAVIFGLCDVFLCGPLWFAAWYVQFKL